MNFAGLEQTDCQGAASCRRRCSSVRTVRPSPPLLVSRRRSFLLISSLRAKREARDQERRRQPKLESRGLYLGNALLSFVRQPILFGVDRQGNLPGRTRSSP